MEHKRNVAVTAAIVALLAGVWLYSVYSASMTKSAPAENVELMLREAENLALDYDKVLSGKDEYVGKYVYWCVQNRSKDEVFYNGDMNARLRISNYASMPRFYSSKHSNCTDTLLNIEDVRKTSSGAGLITAEFVYSR